MERNTLGVKLSDRNSVLRSKTLIVNVGPKVGQPEMKLGRTRLPRVKRAVDKDHDGVDPTQRKPETCNA